MPHTQNSILFGELLCRRYKSHTLYYDEMLCGVLYCLIMTVIPPAKQLSIEMLCCIVLCCYFLL
nr:MAG TPA: hypothetical protein [Caudoviricetes sp.]